MSESSAPERTSRLVRELPPSGIRQFFELVVGVPDVITLGVGEPDFATPWHICDAILHALRRGHTSYTSNYGLLELRQEIAAMLERDYGVQYNPESEIIVTAGVSEALDVLLRAILNPGDEVIVPEPCYVAYKACVSLAGGRPVVVETRSEDGWTLRPEAVREAVTARTRALLIGYPNNPTGAVMTREQLQRIVDVAAEADLLLISDEIYGRLTYEGTHTCVPGLSGAWERTVLLNGFSKAYAMTGWRIGFAAGPADIIEAMVKIHAYTALCAPITGQVAAIEALRNGAAAMASMAAEFDQRRRLVIRGLAEAGLSCFEPKGAFYAFPSVTITGLSSEEFCRRLLHEEKVAIVPGTAFGECGEGYVRCTYANSFEALREALARLKRFVSSHTR
jgi:aminotransferase